MEEAVEELPLFSFMTSQNQEVNVNLVKVSNNRTLIVLSAAVNPQNKQYIPLKKQIDDKEKLKEAILKSLSNLVEIDSEGMLSI